VKNVGIAQNVPSGQADDVLPDRQLSWAIASRGSETEAQCSASAHESRQAEKGSAAEQKPRQPSASRTMQSDKHAPHRDQAGSIGPAQHAETDAASDRRQSHEKASGSISRPSRNWLRQEKPGGSASAAASSVAARRGFNAGRRLSASQNLSTTFRESTASHRMGAAGSERMAARSRWPGAPRPGPSSASGQHGVAGRTGPSCASVVDAAPRARGVHVTVPRGQYIELQSKELWRLV
jgi:hypothetical protein